MKLIIAGPRDLKVHLMQMWDILQEFELEDSRIIHGDCPTGVDRSADRWAQIYSEEEPVAFPANWSRDGKAAGPIRNRKMAEYADALLVIKRKGVETKGTSSMMLEAKQAGIPIYVKEI